uniref:Mamu class II histocompatibility antigen, DR alpha chain-like n=1 Tax=Mastacembelus armatus TaxID=205130 RepID=A0A7N9AQZ6_9TELE
VGEKTFLLLFTVWTQQQTNKQTVCDQVPSVSGQHQDSRISGCSDSDGEDVYGLDGEEKWYADFVNKRGVEPQPSFIDHTSYEEGAYEGAVAQQQVCKQNLKLTRNAVKDLPLENDPPSSPIIYSRDDVELDQQNTLICHVTGFYPAPVKIQWTKNGQNVTEGTSINVPFPNKDGSFRQTSRLEFTPQLGDVYSCTVDHPALDQPLTRIWADVKVSVQQPSVGPAVFCGLGLTVGLLGVAAGTFFLIKGNECS